MQQYGPSFRQAERHMTVERFARRVAPLIALHQGGQDKNNAARRRGRTLPRRRRLDGFSYADAKEAAMSFSARLAPLIVSLLLAVPASAQEIEVEVGTNLFCDTREQVERFVALYDGDTQNAVDGVNAAEHDPSACAVSTVAYVRGPKLATARSKNTAFQIVKILVIGVVAEDGVHAVEPAPFFSVVTVEEISV
jgi:hypothetical protein